VQDDEHPSKLLVSPSSHSSVPALTPSPHTVTQVSFEGLGINPVGHNVQVSWLEIVPPVHIYPESIVQVEEHPSTIIKKLLSSHSSDPALSPSPQ